MLFKINASIVNNYAQYLLLYIIVNARCLKGQCHEIFDLWFFHQTIPPRPLINTLKYF
jgi:hypothetical protein